MNNPQKKPASDLLLKLRWPSEQETMARTGHVVVELQDADGLTVASMSVPKDHLLRAIARDVDHRPLLSLDGCVSAFSDESSLSQLENPPIALDQLVADAVSPEMLDDEPEATHLLSQFRNRLLKSLAHVEQAIASMPEP